MANNGGVSLDELLAARERLNAEKAKSAGRGQAAAPDQGVAEDLTFLRLCGLWLLVTGLLILKVIVVAMTALAEVMEWMRREHQARRRPARRRR